jgi:hypothetical protein
VPIPSTQKAWLTSPRCFRHRKSDTLEVHFVSDLAVQLQRHPSIGSDEAVQKIAAGYDEVAAENDGLRKTISELQRDIERLRVGAVPHLVETNECACAAPAGAERLSMSADWGGPAINGAVR